ncbi:MAG: GNAT family N-acetyltransferase [Candidatus Thermoplasmatota archaeon]|nr:GNAT family N-acetyltransferase [Candidatus Thermoplasmatota archaeon]
MQIRYLTVNNIQTMWEINEQGLPGTGKVSLDEMKNLLNISELSVGAFEDGSLLGFVICLLPNTAYGSLNYAWFNQRFENFIYVDRVAVDEKYRNQGIGQALYDTVFDYASEHQLPVTAEVSLRPQNLGSDRFHLRHGFSAIAEVDHGDKAVTMYIRNIMSSND